MKFSDFVKAKARIFRDEWILEDEEGERVKVDVDIYYEGEGRGRDRYMYPLGVKIAKSFKFGGKIYSKNTEFPEKLGDYIIDIGRKKYDEWLYDLVNEIGD